MNSTTRYLVSRMLGLALLSVLTPTFAQVPSKQVPPDPQQQTVPQEPSKTASSEPSTNVQTFQGTIIKEHDSYVFKDSTGATYQLDASSNMIRVSSISPAS